MVCRERIKCGAANKHARIKNTESGFTLIKRLQIFVLITYCYSIILEWSGHICQRCTLKSSAIDKTIRTGYGPSPDRDLLVAGTIYMRESFMKKK